MAVHWQMSLTHTLNVANSFLVPVFCKGCSHSTVGKVGVCSAEAQFVTSVLLITVSRQVLLAMHANVEDRGIKGDITPLMAAANGGHVKIVKLLLAHGADVNAQSSTGKEGVGNGWRAGICIVQGTWHGSLGAMALSPARQNAFLCFCHLNSLF